MAARFSLPLLGGWRALLSLLYPRLCPGTGQLLLPGEEAVSLACLLALPETGTLHLPSSNELLDRLTALRPEAAALPWQAAAACWYFDDGAPIQHVLHHLKYHQAPELGAVLGRWYGQMLASQPWLAGYQALVPVPLHRKKLHSRGYNQAERIAAGLSEATGLPVRSDLVIRQKHTKTQTRMNRQQRLANVDGAFVAIGEAPTSVLLVDDVMTTGATLHGVGQALVAAGTTRLGVLALAQAR